MQHWLIGQGCPITKMALEVAQALRPQVVGFCTMLPISAGLAEVDAVFIDPGVWRRGIGRLLLIETERRAAMAGVNTLCVTPGGHAVSFYRALGFQHAGKVATEFGSAERLTKKLE
ncbi:GNAT family N-acetyltransferase [Sinorhizobium sp. GL28]|uniref:GNAT family N-acetyltransferase n=1 Tax=Sinorhizobium sp. GL28 TaxID=1358418 RepID=UPI00071D712B|nr:GNAT family N-acetyltransferase [Sinorhizobium sp. GL28]KSV88053.1 hypothetical protein N184_10370 [Sinorhizobium sp. GL28]